MTTGHGGIPLCCLREVSCLQIVTNKNSSNHLGTNLNDAMMEGLDQLRLAGAMDPISASNPGICILFVMTDGVPSKGITNPRTIERNIQDSNQGKCSVVTLGFGADVDFNFLARIALENSGVARKIFEHDEASTQLIGESFIYKLFSFGHRYYRFHCFCEV